MGPSLCLETDIPVWQPSPRRHSAPAHDPHLHTATKGDAHAVDDLCDLARVVALRSGVLLYPGRLHPSPADHRGDRPRDSAPARPPEPAGVASRRLSPSLHCASPGGVLIWEEGARDRIEALACTGMAQY